MRLLLISLVFSIFACACAAKADQEPNCSSFSVFATQSTDEKLTSRFRYGSSDFRGAITFDKKTGELKISAPQSFHMSPTAREDRRLFMDGIQCLIDKSNDINIEKMKSVVFDFSPKYYLCMAANYYSGENFSLSLTEEHVPKSILDPNVTRLLKFAQKAGYFDDWNEILGNYGLEIAEVSPDWIETYNFAELSAVTLDERYLAYCSFDSAGSGHENLQDVALLLPSKLSKIEIKLRK
jgi:hypothetical protein